MTDPDAEVWRHTFEPGPDFSLEVRGIVVGRVYCNDTIPAPPRWYWTITCVRQFVGVTKPSKSDSGFRHTKEEAIEALRAAWVLERDWRAEMRALTPYHDARMPDRVALTAWETYERPAFIEMRGPEGFAEGLGLDSVKAWEIYKAVAQETEPSDANRGEWLAEVRKRMLAAARVG
ncbi:hypothetical protein [Methylorubrum thiocyanatum]|uniref:hypothetical protein n=1 Tax=Methylorubrum thiocyanatum TaxID=47958 RepID=UPI00365F10AD